MMESGPITQLVRAQERIKKLEAQLKPDDAAWKVNVLSSVDDLWIIERYGMKSPVKTGWAVSFCFDDGWVMVQSGLESLDAAKAWVNRQSGGGQDG
jgi:hypothetical protein